MLGVSTKTYMITYTRAFGSFNKIKQARIKMHGKKNSQAVIDVNAHSHLLQKRQIQTRFWLPIFVTLKKREPFNLHMLKTFFLHLEELKFSNSITYFSFLQLCYYFVSSEIFKAVTMKISVLGYESCRYVRSYTSANINCVTSHVVWHIFIYRTTWRHITELIQNKISQPPRSPDLTSLIFFSGSTNANSRWTCTQRWNVRL